MYLPYELMNAIIDYVYIIKFGKKVVNQNMVITKLFPSKLLFTAVVMYIHKFATSVSAYYCFADS